MKHQNGFTLVELAIVLMIIGLLIGGILKGQELITNARITSTIRQVKSHDAAIITFKDSYGSLPGDISNASTRLPNCSAAPCNINGNGNSIIGTPNVDDDDETAAMWQHLAAANLISGIDTSVTWTSGNISSASFPALPISGIEAVLHRTIAANASYTQGLNGHYYYFVGRGFIRQPPTDAVGRIDQKIDDGHPWTGDVVIGSVSCGVANGATTYGAGNTTACALIIKPQF